MFVDRGKGYPRANRQRGADLFRQHTQAPDPKVHAQTVGAELETISGGPGATKEVTRAYHDRAEPDLQGQLGDPNANIPKGVAHAEPDSMPGEDTNPNVYTPEGVAHTEPDSTPGEETDPNTDARAHLEGAGPEILLEEGTIGENASVEEDRYPRVELLEPGVSRLATPEEVEFLTSLSSSSSSSSSSSPTTFEAARMQHSPVVNAGMPAIPEPDRGRIWTRHHMTRRRQMGLRNPLPTIHPSRSSAPRM